MEKKRALEYWINRYNSAKDYNDIHWDAEERHEHRDYISAMAWAIKAIEQYTDVHPADRWINVDDRLPEEIGYYLVIIGNDMLYSIDIAEYSENRWHKHDRVIYWQDLPDYPKSIKGE